jgi:hypothetical protein
MCCRSKPIGEQRQATREAGRLPRRLVGPGPSVNGPEVRHTPWLDEMLGVPPDLYLIREVKKSLSVISLHAQPCQTLVRAAIGSQNDSQDRLEEPMVPPHWVGPVLVLGRTSG